MIVLKNMSTKFLVITILERVLAILGCLLILFSFIYPFYFASFKTLAGGGSIYYWSYRVDYRNEVMVVLHSEHFWFSDFWFSSYDYVSLEIPWVLISLFTVQVLTLAFGVASVIFNRRILSFAPVPLSLAFMALMIYTGEIFFRYWQWPGYQLGYYLVYPSAVLFLSAFVLAEARALLKEK